MLEECVVLRPRKAFMIPHTVPNSPMNGVALAVVARKVRVLSRRVISCVVARFMPRSTLATPPRSVVKLASPGLPGRLLRVRRMSSW